MGALTLHVNNSLNVNILPNQQHEFIMTSKEVALGYGVAEKTVRNHLSNNLDELHEGKHFVRGAHILGTLTGTNHQPHQTFWTKRGVVRLGFFIKSERAKQFRDWAEDLVIFASENNPYQLMEQRLQQLEAKLTELQRPALAAPSFADVQANMLQFFAKWLKRGDLTALSQRENYHYRYLQAVKLGIKRSHVVEKLLFDICLQNQADAAKQNGLLN